MPEGSQPTLRTVSLKKACPSLTTFFPCRCSPPAALLQTRAPSSLDNGPVLLPGVLLSFQTFSQVSPFAYWVVFLWQGHYSCFFLHSETNCHFSLTQWPHTLPSVLFLHSYLLLSDSVLSSCAPTRKASWLPLLNQHAPHQYFGKVPKHKQKHPASTYGIKHFQ